MALNLDRDSNLPPETRMIAPKLIVRSSTVREKPAAKPARSRRGPS
jgi:hypothetical protein